MTYECIGCEENCHTINIPWWGNKCLAGRVNSECFIKIQDVE
jgi:hypothetical protein